MKVSGRRETAGWSPISMMYRVLVGYQGEARRRDEIECATNGFPSPRIISSFLVTFRQEGLYIYYSSFVIDAH